MSNPAAYASRPFASGLNRGAAQQQRLDKQPQQQSQPQRQQQQVEPHNVLADLSEEQREEINEAVCPILIPNVQ